jgi:hypothetical protein
MAKSFNLDLGPLVDLLTKSQTATARGATRAMDDIKDDWVKESRDIAPLDTGNLRKQIHGKVEGAGLGSTVEITANAASKSGGKRFNYAYYIHEGFMANDGKKLRHPGTIEQFLDESAEKRKKEWLKFLEEEIKDELKREGW